MTSTNTAPLPTEAAVEAATRALWERAGKPGGHKECGRACMFTDQAVTALTAAAQVQPVVEADEREAQWMSQVMQALHAATTITERALRTGVPEGINGGNHDRLIREGAAILARRSQPAPRTDLCTVCNKYPSHVEHRHPGQPAPEADEWEPMLVSAMRRRPVGEVIYQPANGPKMGTTARTFLAEYDRARRSQPAPEGDCSRCGARFECAGCGRLMGADRQPAPRTVTAEERGAQDVLRSMLRTGPTRAVTVVSTATLAAALGITVEVTP